MNRIDELRQQIAAIDEQKKPLEKELRELYKVQEDEVKEKVQKCHKLEDKFSQDELVYAAFDRCNCGAGLAYPKNTGMHGSWNCSAILTGTADATFKHDAGFPFAFYSIKSESQPSANGATTRPKES